MPFWAVAAPILATVGSAGLQAYAGRKQQQRALAVENIQQQGSEAQKEIEQERQKTQGSLSDLIDAYRSALG